MPACCGRDRWVVSRPLSVKYLYCGEFDGKVSAVGLIGADVDRAFVQGDDPLGHGQAEAEDAGTGRAGPAVKGLEDLLDLLGRYYGSLVDDLHIDFVPGEAEIDDGAFVGGVLTTILHYIFQSNIEQFAVPEDDKVFFIFREFAEVQFNAVFRV